jgi:hypothetical protein
MRSAHAVGSGPAVAGTAGAADAGDVAGDVAAGVAAGLAVARARAGARGAPAGLAARGAILDTAAM